MSEAGPTARNALGCAASDASGPLCSIPLWP